MINKVILIFSAIATVQCQYPVIPQQYSRPCGVPTVPTLPPMLQTRPTCANIPISLLPNVAPTCAKSLPISILNSRYELPIAPKSPLLPSFELPIPLATPNCLKSPYELALPIALQKPYALENAVPKLDIPLPRNPFLPAASPVSPLSPFSPSLPPANSCSRCQYLKKIPIPPPCI